MTTEQEDKKEIDEKPVSKLAKPDSLIFRSHYAQQRRKKRKERNEEIE